MENWKGKEKSQQEDMTFSVVWTKEIGKMTNKEFFF
jgi:hypothetical protein